MDIVRRERLHGAAFGPEMERIMKLIQMNNNVNLYLPESFEWIILSSELFAEQEIKDILAKPYDYIDSADYLSWERFFTKVLIDKTKDTYLSYKKTELNSTYQQDYVMGKVLDVMQKIDFKWRNRD